MGPIDILLVLLLILWAGWAIRHRKSCGRVQRGPAADAAPAARTTALCENQQPTKEADPRRYEPPQIVQTAQKEPPVREY